LRKQGRGGENNDVFGYPVTCLSLVSLGKGPKPGVAELLLLATAGTVRLCGVRQAGVPRACSGVGGGSGHPLAFGAVPWADADGVGSGVPACLPVGQEMKGAAALTSP